MSLLNKLLRKKRKPKPTVQELYYDKQLLSYINRLPKKVKPAQLTLTSQQREDIYFANLKRKK